MKYKPLPFYLTIKDSKIHGLGLFALVKIDKNHTIGMTHLQVENDLIRTPLGGFINHSEEPNLVKKEFNNRWFVKTTRDIERINTNTTYSLINAIFKEDFTKTEDITLTDEALKPHPENYKKTTRPIRTYIKIYTGKWYL